MNILLYSLEGMQIVHVTGRKRKIEGGILQLPERLYVS